MKLVGKIILLSTKNFVVYSNNTKIVCLNYVQTIIREENVTVVQTGNKDEPVTVTMTIQTIRR